ASAAAKAAAASIPIREADIESAEERVEDIRSAWARGIDTYTAEDLSRAQAEVERTTALLDGARAAIARGEREAKSSDVAVAQIVAAAIRDVYDWLEVVPTFLPPIMAADSDSAVYVVQTAPTERTGLGVVSGT